MYFTHICLRFELQGCKNNVYTVTISVTVPLENSPNKNKQAEIVLLQFIYTQYQVYRLSYRQCSRYRLFHQQLPIQLTHFFVIYIQGMQGRPQQTESESSGTNHRSASGIHLQTKYRQVYYSLFRPRSRQH